MNRSIDYGILRISKSRASWHRIMAQTLLVTGTLLLIVGLAALWSASIRSVFAGTPPDTATDATQNSKVPTAPNCGPNWTVVPSSNVGSATNYLNDVSAVSASVVWAVGEYGSSGLGYR